ncbi:phosphotransferase [Zavarzinia sp. CC-PAN008]|uniref:phosphotransferase n=1 Tax=Zavarzinia sp. CC-PAN008 TaxID=3243332 RepID=UPI003F7443E1
MSAADPSAVETTEIRAAHTFDVKKLESWCLQNVDGFKAPLVVRQFVGGQSNPTFFLESPSGRYVMRKKPPGKLLASAHQVDREFKAIKALNGTAVPVAPAYALCMDDEVVGTAFYIMGHVEGRIFRDPQLPGVSPADRAAIYDDMNRVMAELHKVDYEAVGLGDFGRPGNYFERQIARWIKQYEPVKTDDIEAMDNLIAWLPKNIPEDNSVAIAHGDYRLENSIYHPTEPRMIALLDWELATIGHPLADLSYNCMLYHRRHERMGSLTDIEPGSGIPGEKEYVEAYCRRTGRDGIKDWDFYLAFSFFRLASITQGVYKRGLDGNASSDTAITYATGCRNLAEAGWSFVEKRA